MYSLFNNKIQKSGIRKLQSANNNLTYQKGNKMSKEPVEATKTYFAKINKAFKIGSLVFTAAITTLQIVSALREDEQETGKI